MNEDMKRNIRRVAFSLLSLLLILFFYLTYIQVVKSDALMTHPLNRRLSMLTNRMPRGQILDQEGHKLAYSVQNADGVYQREYPYGSILSHVVGYDSSKYGNTGIESSFNGYLSGMYNSGYHLGAISHLFTNTSNNVILTIDTAVQEQAYRALGKHKGAIVVISPHTGAILAMVSKPSFDANHIDRDWQEISGAASSPLLNRAVQGLYPPGSSIKPMVAEAALHDKVITPTQTIVDCKGALKIGDYELTEINRQAYGPINLEQALAKSSNVAFGTLALKLGRNGMEKTFERYGFDKPIGEEFAEASSRLPAFSRLGDGDLAQTGIGQGSLLVTPMRMAMLAAGLANRGIIMKPYLVSEVKTPDGSTVKRFASEKWLTVTDAALAETITKMMVGVVKNGTGSGAQIGGIVVAGKTGTAENPLGASHAWFIGFAPAFDPQVAIAVVVENGGSGGSIAAPIARQVMAQALH